MRWNRTEMWVGVIVALCAAACSKPEADVPAGAASARAALAATAGERILSWGVGPGQVALSPAAPERLAGGASAVAVGPAGGVYVLDRLGGRVFRVGGGSIQTAARVPEDAEDLAVGPDGALAVHSLLRARVWIFAGGEAAGEVRVPRLLRQLQGLELRSSRRVYVFSALQEHYPLGSPSFSLQDGAVIAGAREGAAVLDSGASVAVRRHDDSRVEISLQRQDDERTRVVARFVLPERALAARVVGAVDARICVKLEQEAPGSRGEVQRRVSCIDARTGRRFFTRALGGPGIYVPRVELAVGGSPARLAFIRPGPRGLGLTVWDLDRGRRAK